MSVVNMNAAGNSSTMTGLRVLLFRQAFFNGSRPSNPSLMSGHKSLTSSTKVKEIQQELEKTEEG